MVMQQQSPPAFIGLTCIAAQYPSDRGAILPEPAAQLIIGERESRRRLFLVVLMLLQCLSDHRHLKLLHRRLTG